MSYKVSVIIEKDEHGIASKDSSAGVKMCRVHRGSGSGFGSDRFM